MDNLYVSHALGFSAFPSGMSVTFVPDQGSIMVTRYQVLYSGQRSILLRWEN